MTVDYGFDMWGNTDISPTLQDVAGNSLMAQVICRRLFTPPGGMISAPDEPTVDLRSFLSTAQELDNSGLGRIKGSIINSVSADPRVFSVTATVTYDPDTETLTVICAGEGADGPFRLTLAVTSVTVDLLNS